MEWSDEFFTERRLTSKLKHLVLKRYVKEFAYHLGSTNPTVYYIDGFAGPGTYGPPHQDGSPLLIARLAHEIRTGPNPVTLRCINVEAKPKNFKSLEAATRPFVGDVIDKNIPSTFVEAIPEILAHVGDAAAFFFIDPFGTKDIPFEELRPIFCRKATTEVLITLHTDGIAKKAGWFANLDSPDEKIRRNAEKLTSHLAAALDIPLEQLKAGWADSLSKGGTSNFEDRVWRWYTRRLKTKGRTRFGLAKAFRVLYRPEPHASVCFHLVFGTQNRTGLIEMNNAMANALDDFYDDFYSNLYRGTLFPEYAEERAQQLGREAVRKQLLEDFASTEFTIEDIRLHFIQQTDFVLKAGEYRALVLEMRKKGTLKRLDTGPLKNSSRFRVSTSEDG
jgi:three-Cys-motif partner protein